MENAQYPREIMQISIYFAGLIRESKRRDSWSILGWKLAFTISKHKHEQTHIFSLCAVMVKWLPHFRAPIRKRLPGKYFSIAHCLPRKKGWSFIIENGRGRYSWRNLWGRVHWGNLFFLWISEIILERISIGTSGGQKSLKDFFKEINC